VRREQLCLLGVRAVPRGDQQRQARLGAGGGRHAIEGGRHVWPHRLSLPVGERAGVAAAAAVRGHAEAGTEVGRDLRRRTGTHLDPFAPGAARKPDLRLAPHADGDPRGREQRARERDVDQVRRNAVATRPA
jgi:hypothetical protein